MSANSSNRDDRIDVLRAVGLLLVIFAHVSAPGFLNQIRRFDVALLVFVSGSSFAITGSKRTSFPFIFSRFKTIVLPLWKFLAFYFLIVWSLDLKNYSFSTVIDTFLLKDGIGYVWVIRVFFIVYLLAPLLLLNPKIQKNPHLVWAIFFSLLCLHLALVNNSPAILGYSVFLSYLVNDIIKYVIIYFAFYVLGYYYKLNEDVLNLKLIISISVIFSLYLMFFLNSYYLENHSLISFWYYKYPPQLPYIAISIIGTLLVVTFVKYVRVPELVLGYFRYLSVNSLWLYLWHIPFIEILNINWFIKYPITVLGCIFAYEFQKATTKNLVKK